MKILHVAETFKGGVATVLNSLASYQLRCKDANQVQVLIPKQHSKQLESSLINHASYFERDKRGMASLISLAFKIYKKTKEFEPDIIHFHSTFAGVIGRITVAILFPRKSIKVVYCPHAFPFLMVTGKIKKRLYIACEKILSILTDKIICVGMNEYDAAVAVKIPENKLVVINNGVELPLIKNENINNNQSEYLLLYVGRFDYQKGTDILIDALKIIDNTPLDFRLKMLMVGESVNDDVNYELPKFNNIDVEFTGWIPQNELFQYYTKANCLVIPSRWEGLAMVPLEAISYKLPVIASDIPAFHEINQVSNLYFSNGDSDSLAKLLINIKKYDFDMIKNQLYEMVSHDYTKEVMNEKTLALYREITKGA
ncbi:glycosyltransferase family 4 protein [Klebsiella variicola]|uniref:glycosyltransferase n=1 Tax=Klebsiella variicola TaxID=244366 RepID=UPI0010A6883D|nr:glycosyltransferase [Klebsiella variicola]THG58363.1 glycosyltransferase family 4 protein [Klebsiella variicola]